MNKTVIKENKYRYIESGEGQAIIILHGLMGGLSNFKTVYDFFPLKGFKVIIPELPIYSMPISDTTLKSLSEFLYEFIAFKGLVDMASSSAFFTFLSQERRSRR